MYPTDDDIHGPAGADAASDAGRRERPIPQTERIADPAQQPRLDSRHIPPHARPHRDAAMSSKMLVWGGVALGVAGLTLGTILATRKVASLVADDAAPRRPDYRYEGRNEQALAPRFADLPEDEKEAIRRRVRAQARADERSAERARAEASRLRSDAPRRNVAHDLTRTANEVSASLEGVARSVASAFDSFRSVATQASAIVGEFAGAADQVRSVLHPTEPRSRTARTTGARDDLKRDEDERPPADRDDPRYHRL